MNRYLCPRCSKHIDRPNEAAKPLCPCGTDDSMLDVTTLGDTARPCNVPIIMPAQVIQDAIREMEAVRRMTKRGQFEQVNAALGGIQGSLEEAMRVGTIVVPDEQKREA